jgi:hypothetical protein
MRGRVLALVTLLRRSATMAAQTTTCATIQVDLVSDTM